MKKRKLKNIKRMKIVKFFIWLFSEKPKKLSKRDERNFKHSIRIFFEGIRYGADVYSEPIYNIPINKLGITDLKFREFKSKYVITITLERPGIIIGKRGRVIDALNNHLSNKYNKPVKILIKESKLWW